MRGLVVLGSTGSIGRQTLDVVRAFPDEFEVIGLAAGRNLDLLKSQVEEFNPRFAWCALEEERALLPDSAAIMPMEEMVCLPEAELIMAATIGSAGLVPTIRALEQGKAIALSNKEVIIMAGEMVMSMAETHGATVLPVDSEPSAIWQCLQGETDPIRRLVIYCVGRPLPGLQARRLRTGHARASPETIPPGGWATR